MAASAAPTIDPAHTMPTSHVASAAAKGAPALDGDDIDRSERPKWGLRHGRLRGITHDGAPIAVRTAELAATVARAAKVVVVDIVARTLPSCSNSN